MHGCRRKMTKNGIRTPATAVTQLSCFFLWQHRWDYTTKTQREKITAKLGVNAKLFFYKKKRMQNLVTSLHKAVRRTPRPLICENQRSFTLEERSSNEFSSSRQYHGRPGQARTRYRRACHPCGFDHDAQPPPPPLLRFALYPHPSRFPSPTHIYMH
jgi:hypothetical protein